VRMVTDEKQLIEQLKNGDYGAFELLVKFHYRAAYNLAFRFMGDHGGADDVVQDSFVKAFNAITNFRMESSFKSWLLKIVANTAKNALRSINRRTMVDVEDAGLKSVHIEYHRLEKMQTAELLRVLVEQLPARQKHILELRIYDDLSFKEIAEIVDSPFDTVKANFRHAIQNLRKCLSSVEGSKSMDELQQAFESLGFEEDGHES
jgi:RNA polymerase sigma-70 factor (ECF subfamily)